ncbi:MAG: PASTA domain-containing protein [Prevotellaceae bacterium]|jgi:beta-lactam-binding protein with PASTA domain|nr:PASTA domain-containing protein [Prevotellaceae bacterium]
MLKRFFKNVWVRHLAGAFLTVIFIFAFSNVFLDYFTRHGDSFPLPEFTGRTLDSVRFIAQANDLRLEVIDSVYRRDVPGGVIFMQNPEAGMSVKKNRKVFLTINSRSPQKELVPWVVGFSLRQAKAKLNAVGLRVGKLIYDNSDPATDNVLQQKYKGRYINDGEKIPVGEYIDLVLGLNFEELTVSVPDLIGRSKHTVEDALVESSLNYSLVFDRTVKNYTDSLNAVAYRQDPAAGTKLDRGSTVEIRFKYSK